MTTHPSELYAMMGLTKANAKRRGHAVLWRRHAVRQVLYELSYTMDAIALMERNLFGTRADHSTISNSIDQPYHRLIESMKDEARRYADHYGIPRNPDHVQSDPFSDKIRLVLKAMGASGHDGAKEFWDEFQMRALEALGLLMRADVRPISNQELYGKIHGAIPWEENYTPADVEPDDFTARLGRFMLRCEQMDRYSWWWCVYDDMEQVDTGFCHTKELAMQAAEKLYKELLEATNG